MTSNTRRLLSRRVSRYELWIDRKRRELVGDMGVGAAKDAMRQRLLNSAFTTHEAYDGSVDKATFAWMNGVNVTDPQWDRHSLFPTAKNDFSAAVRGAAQAALMHDPLIEGNVMLLDGRLAHEILSSADTGPLTDIDLAHLPYTSVVVELTEPIELRCDEIDWTSQLYALSLFSDPQRHLYGGAMVLKAAFVNSQNDPISTLWPLGVIHDPVNDRFTHNVDPRLVGLCPVDVLSPNARQRRSADGLAEIISRHCRKLLLFLTCRNIDYENVTRAAPRGKAWRHVSADATTRELKVIAVNRTEQRLEDSARDRSQESSLLYREHVCGSFHRWFYCLNCRRVHRHDMIGQPCRRCRQQVGPVSNLIAKTYWHPPHWRGPELAPVKPTVTLVENTRSTVKARADSRN